ncbi:hypothetical protein DSO57_1036858 [Entomophthora muscae]|uniref:Uncharacterized protein n=1 Tax=Entomophthora muscae TaxID=34485 RepID=A0ACC2UJQ7_9FUNG|nr:hypothetical protein DSO57_1036858 [Entomophthora muscae]
MKTIFPGAFIAAESFSVAHGAAKLYAEGPSRLMEISHVNFYAKGSINNAMPTIFKGASLPTSNPMCFTVPYPSNSFTISFTSESLLLDSFKANNHIAYNMKLKFILEVDINGIFNVTYYAQSHLVLIIFCLPLQIHLS